VSITASDIGAENVPEAWLDAVNARLGVLHHADMCGCDGWPEACENYKPGDWDASPTALLVAAVVLEPLIRERDAAELELARPLRLEWSSTCAAINREVHTPAKVTAYLAAHNWFAHRNHRDGEYWANVAAERTILVPLDADYDVRDMAEVVRELADAYGLGELGVLHGIAAVELEASQ